MARKKQVQPGAQRRGFTLIELMIVIALIGTLAAVATPYFRKAREDAQRRACYENQRKISGAIEQFNLDQNESIKEVDPQFLSQLVGGDYLRTNPICPSVGDTTVYKIQAVTGDENSIYCTIHGSVLSQTPADKPPPSGSSRESRLHRVRGEHRGLRVERRDAGHRCLGPTLSQLVPIRKPVRPDPSASSGEGPLLLQHWPSTGSGRTDWGFPDGNQLLVASNTIPPKGTSVNSASSVGDL